MSTPAIAPEALRGSAADIQSIQIPYRRHADQDADVPARHPVVVVGAGPVGLSLAIDLAQRGQPVVVLDNDCKLSTGSRAICFSKRTLEIWDRLGVGQPMVDKGVSWNLGKVFARDQSLYQFDLLPEAGHERPAFINLQQYYAEAYLVERALQLPLIDLRWHNKVTALVPRDDGALVSVETPEGEYRIDAQWVLACDGSRSPLRGLLGQESHGRIFRDRFLIADVKMHADFPTERWFWFDPPFHPGQSVLLHRQPDDVWRIDFQLGWEADPEEEKKPENILPRIRALLGKDAHFELEWASVYTFACLRMDRFVHGRVVFAGDSAHGVSPFGARGANSGVQDAENLAWKLDRVLRGQADSALIATYGAEREYAADENIRNSTRATDFITPKSEISRLFRDAALELAREHEFARRIVNSGRLSVPATLQHSPLNTPDGEVFEGSQMPGAVLSDAPMRRPGDSQTTWLLRALGTDFTLLHFGPTPAWARELGGVLNLSIAAEGDAGAAQADLLDVQGLAAQRLDARPGTCYLLRPDQHVCARWRRPDEAGVRAALLQASGALQ
ncbi:MULTISPECIES: FAD-dependent oxidoreductase [Comamonas]|uniref:FAD-dependent oxidoreductase n=1 Tax=Comamonas testosteroni TaxID=285 RepID=A0A096FAP3_COMTE|nr:MULTISPECIES: FAD-dependent oxidoreductase [Comamonas]KGH26833.1 FAD-dependent oxidoreductase [Comamonas testosteroni]MPT10406.1 FAD-dependent oxidoreductase [Comamonas sp.]